jgi:hypothetical protein
MNLASHRRLFVVALVALIVGLIAGSAGAATPFVDTAGNNHADNIEAIRSAGITLGCTDTTHYCPSDFVRRDQMASFLARLGGLSSGTTKNYPKVNARSDLQSFCAVAAANPQSFADGQCRDRVTDLTISPSTARRPSLAVGVDGLLAMSYYDSSNGDLVYLRCSDAGCGTSTRQTVASTDDVGSASSLAFDDQAIPTIAFYDGTNRDLRIAQCTNVQCSGPVSVNNLDAGADDVGRVNAITIAPGGHPTVSYVDTTTHQLKVAHCEVLPCSFASVNVIDAATAVDSQTDIALGVDGLPVISYYDATNDDLKVAHCTAGDCSTADITTLDAADDVGQGSSIAIGTDGFPVISYYDATNKDLKVAHCTNRA